MRRILAVMTVAFVAMGAAGAPAVAATYGALAFATQNGALGYATGYKAQGDAERAAMQQCKKYGGKGCTGVFWVRDACGAIASGDNLGYGYAWHSSKKAARNEAVAQCKARDNGCKVRVAFCSND